MAVICNDNGGIQLQYSPALSIEIFNPKNEIATTREMKRQERGWTKRCALALGLGRMMNEERFG